MGDSSSDSDFKKSTSKVTRIDMSSESADYITPSESASSQVCSLLFPSMCPFLCLCQYTACAMGTRNGSLISYVYSCPCQCIRGVSVKSLL